jgi:hypothetical protein
MQMTLKKKIEPLKSTIYAPSCHQEVSLKFSSSLSLWKVTKFLKSLQDDYSIKR